LAGRDADQPPLKPNDGFVALASIRPPAELPPIAPAGGTVILASPRAPSPAPLDLSLAPTAGHVPYPRALQRVALLGNHLPRQCGIATFTTDLAGAIAAAYPALDTLVVAMNDAGPPHAYPAAVRFEVEQDDVASYRRAVDFLNVSDVDAVSLQHEFGIFGGKAGALLLPLLAELRMPIVTTLHTILATPDPAQRRVMEEIVRYSERLVVMSAHGATLLRDVYGVDPARVDHIPHGIPEVMFAVGDKDRLGVAGKQVILTFGLLSPDKGIEHVIDALPQILARHPHVVYIVLGATHPHVLAQTGESYRLMLEARAQALGVDGSIIFHNRFVSQQELGEFLTAADLYVTPYHNLEQSTSGTLAYAVGAGKAIISTPYRYATELLAQGRGLLVPVRDPDSIARAVISLFSDEVRMVAMREKAAHFGSAMAWPAVARLHVAALEHAAASHAHRRRSVFRARTLAERPASLPELRLDHLQCITDDTGVLQHASFVVPRYADGYCLDDNARALALMVLLEESGGAERRTVRALASRYLAFVSNAFDERSGRFRNFLSYSRMWGESVGSEDSQGRGLWALGTVVGRALDPGRRSLAGDLFHAALPAMASLGSPRAWAYALLGINEYLHAFGGDRAVQAMRTLLTDRLADIHARASAPDWPWFEASLTYGNARLSQALLVSGEAMGRADLVATGLQSLAWLAKLQHTPDGFFSPIGSNGFYARGGERARFDQQPVEACGMVAACHDALRITGDIRWASEANAAFSWFLGQNHLQQPVYDVSSGGCRDGLHAERTNENQGAESTLSFLMALHDMRAAARAEPV
jgi:glycosyltransferase involved in cell wall biosynthesis